jgi:metal-responsive CopG/Arc/MetJ family transcriptional regulator
MPTDKETLHKLQVNISKNALKEIDNIKDRIEAGSRTEVIKSSLKYFNFITKEKEKDKDVKILVKDSKGNTKEIIF